jgi:hypothetical protein
MKTTSFAIAAILAATAASAEAGTLKFKGEGATFVDFKIWDMADGSQAQNFVSQVVTTVVDGDMKDSTLSGICYGTGRITKAAPWTGFHHCTFSLSAEDAYSIEARDDEKGGRFTVIGGKGKFAGATGGGAFQYLWGDTQYGDKLKWASDVEITTP